MTGSTIVTTDGRRWRIQPDPDEGGWFISYWCDCAFGPHWHEQKWTRTKAEAEALVIAEGSAT